jgi:hypothetical protein
LFEAQGCYRQAIEALSDCFDGGRIGVFSQNRTKCDFTGGAHIDFADAPLSGSVAWNFDVSVGGASCASYREFDTEGVYGFEVVRPSGRFRFERSLDSVTVTCPNETAVRFTREESLACLADQDASRSMPQRVADFLPFSVEFRFGVPDGYLQMFRCEEPHDP